MTARTSTAEWLGPVPGGSGTMALGSGAYQGAYSFESRFESGTGTNPEELIAAAHAGCFSMSLSHVLGEAGYSARSVQTSATVRLEAKDGGFAITRVDLSTHAEVPGIDSERFQELVNVAKAGCIVSKALAVEITLDAELLAGVAP
jgi:lipoyl-dependent peroxiredoxin